MTQKATTAQVFHSESLAGFRVSIRCAPRKESVCGKKASDMK